MSASPSGTLTGRKVLLIATVAFAIILTPNIILLVKAVSTFSGLVVPNSYVASQEFDRRRMSQEALGWNLAIAEDEGVFSLAITDADGAVVRPATLSVVIGRLTTWRSDLPLELFPTSAGYAAAADLAPGNWMVEINATADDGTGFTQRRSLMVRQPK